jgi:hypothetical protein
MTYGNEDRPAKSGKVVLGHGPRFRLRHLNL